MEPSSSPSSCSCFSSSCVNYFPTSPSFSSTSTFFCFLLLILVLFPSSSSSLSVSSFVCCDSSNYDLSASIPNNFDWETSTVELWVAVGDEPSAYTSGTLIQKWDGSATTAISVKFSWAGSPWLLDALIRYKNGATYTLTTGSLVGSPSTLTWRHVAYVRDGTTSRLYVDGVRIADLGAVDCPNNKCDNNRDLQICASASPIALSEVRLWTVALTDSQIASRWETRLTGAEADLAQYWPLTNDFFTGVGGSDLNAQVGTPDFQGSSLCNAVESSLMASPSPSTSRTRTRTPTRSRSATRSRSPSVSPSKSRSPSRSWSGSVSPSRTTTSSISSTISLTPSITLSTSLSSSVTKTPVSPSITPTTSLTSSITLSSSVSSSVTASSSITPSVTSSLSTTSSRSPSFSSLVTATGDLTQSRTPSLSESPSESLLPSISSPASTSKTPQGDNTKQPSPTPKSEPAEQEEIPGEEEVVNICNDPNLPLGCNGKCVSDISLCTGSTTCSDPEECTPAQGDEDSPVVPVDVVVPDNDKSIKVPVVKEDGGYVGTVDIPSGTFKEGTIIRVQPFQGTLPEEEEEKDKCGSSSSSSSSSSKEGKQRVSGLFEITALRPDGEKAKLKKAVNITFLVILPDGADVEDICFSFNQGEEGSSWNCEESENVWFEKVKVGNNGTTYLITQQFDHFTGFSVLLGNTSLSDCGIGNLTTIHWLSIAFLIAAGIVIAIVCYIYNIYFTRELKKSAKSIRNAIRASQNPQVRLEIV